MNLRNQTSPTTRSKTTSPHPFEACLDTLMAGRHTSLSHYCRLPTGHPDRRLDTSRSLHSVFGCRISRPASGYTFPLCIRRLIICCTLPHWAEAVHGRTQQGVWSIALRYHPGRKLFTEEQSTAFAFLHFPSSFFFLRLLLRSTTLPSHISRAASSLVAFAALRLSDANAVACSSSSTLSPRPLDVKGAIINTETGDEEID